MFTLTSNKQVVDTLKASMQIYSCLLFSSIVLGLIGVPIVLLYVLVAAAINFILVIESVMAFCKNKQSRM